MRDEERVKRDKGRRIDMVRYAITLNKLTIINATYPKQSFSEKSISEVISYLSNSLGVRLILWENILHNSIKFEIILQS